MTKETPQQRERRLENARQKRLEKILLESPSAKRARLDKNNQNRSKQRANETQQQRELRLIRDREQHAAAFEIMTPEQRELRLNRDREQHAAAFENMTPEQRELRLNRDREQHAAAFENMTPEQRELRLNRDREQHAAAFENMTPEQRELRLNRDREQHAAAFENMTPEQRELRLNRDREQHAAAFENMTPEQRELRLNRDREQHAAAFENMTPEQRELRLNRDREQHAAAFENMTPEQREIRLNQVRDQMAQVRENESPEQRELRLNQDREHHTEARINESQQQRQERLQNDRIRHIQRQREINADEATFNASVNTFAEFTCDICTKQCYPKQKLVVHLNHGRPLPSYLPDEIAGRDSLVCCNRCNNHIFIEKKPTAPSKAYWNNLYPGDIPDVIKVLSQVEIRLLSRMIAFNKIVKYSGIFGQYGCKGQSVLFAQDIFEVTEKLPNMLPRSTDNTGIAVITEVLENLNISREFSVSREKVYAALNWLIANNHLYHDVTIDHDARIVEGDIVRVTEPENSPEEEEPVHAYKRIGEVSRILRASWHQGNSGFFNPMNVGVQCCAMVLANIVRSSILPPGEWVQNILNENMMAGDGIYSMIRDLTESNEIEQNGGFLCVQNFDVIKQNFVMYGKSFSLSFDEFPAISGSLHDPVNTEDGPGLTLANGLATLFANHNAGILIASSKCFGVVHYDGKYYFTDSHSCGEKGASAGNGKACVIECDNMKELLRVCKRATGRQNVPYTIDYIDVIATNEPVSSITLQEPATTTAFQCPMTAQVEEQLNNVFAMHTSVMAPIDCVQPAVEEELEVSPNEIVRKTDNNIVNDAYEKKAEEFSWWSLFPFGINGYKDDRPVEITPLDYYQSRILGSDQRFQRNDYLFYALSMFEYRRVRSTLNALAKKVQGQDGVIDDVHLYIKNLRGSAAYWQTALNELIAMIRCLGPPTYFLTFSCNDLYWFDMKKALLIADGRPNDDPNDLDVHATQRLIELYPVVVSRHFMIRVNALMVFLKASNILGGTLKDFWWRIEFQNRGSPHLHMVVWIEGHPSFETEEGIQVLDQVASCGLPDDDEELLELVTKFQIHRHTQTCTKNHQSSMCRFAFPRRECTETRVVQHTSNDFIQNGGRICLLKRRAREKWVNNYNPVLLRLWKGNMDIQPCGNNESIAYYIAKYMSKSEPTELNSSVAQAIRQLRREETNISRRLFKICMRILKERQVSACECVFRLCHLKLRHGSRRCIFLNTRKPEQRYKVLKFDNTDTATDFCSNIIERYEKRPLQHPVYDFENMCLIEFAMLFDSHYKKNKGSDNEGNIDEDAYGHEEQQPRRKKFITLTDNTKMAIRTTPAVVRVPFFMVGNDPENYYYSLLAQYMPFRSESELMQGFTSARDAFIECEKHMKDTSEHLNLLRNRDRQLEAAFNRVHAFEILENQPTADVGEEIEVTDQPMDDQQFQEARRAMNVGQSEIYNFFARTIRDQMNGDPSRIYQFITGEGGTGKTFLLKVLKNQIIRCYGGKQAVKVCALTGVAAKLVGGATLHSTLKLPVQKDGRLVTLPLLTGNTLEIMRRQWRDIEFLFIDEISMVPYEMLCNIESRLRQLKHNEELLFGGINVILFGDLMQLKPVRGHQVFDQPARMAPATHLWRLNTLVELKENMRQQGDTTFRDILNALRIGELKPVHLAALMTKVSRSATGLFSIENALRIYPTNAQVKEHNDRVVEHFKVKNVEMFKIIAQDHATDGNLARNVNIADIVSDDINKTGGLPKELEIFVGAKVMLRSNINVARGLVNGAIGSITRVIWPHFRRAQMYEEDLPSVEIDFGNGNLQVIAPISIQFPSNYNKATIERRMLPLILSWASTVHKMQGSTVDHAVVYLGPRLFQEGQAYVALSRVRSLDGLLIEDLDCAKLTGKTPCNMDALQEMERMRNFLPDQH